MRVPIVLPLFLCVACGDGAPGDLDLVPAPSGNVRGNGLTLAELNDPAKPRPPQSSEVFVTGVSVVAVDDFDETQTGSSAGNIYAQDLAIDGPTPPYGGITLFDASFSPPALRVTVGDVIDVRGAYEEFAGPPSSPFPCFKLGSDGVTCEVAETLPEIVGGAIKLRFEAAPPAPQTIDLNDLGSYDTGRKWIGMLVRIENAVAESDGFKANSGRYSIRLVVPGVTGSKLPAINNAFMDLETSGIATTKGSTYPAVVGVVQYFYNFTISPRSIEDITP